MWVRWWLDWLLTQLILYQTKVFIWWNTRLLLSDLTLKNYVHLNLKVESRFFTYLFVCIVIFIRIGYDIQKIEIYISHRYCKHIYIAMKYTNRQIYFLHSTQKHTNEHWSILSRKLYSRTETRINQKTFNRTRGIILFLLISRFECGTVRFSLNCMWLSIVFYLYICNTHIPCP